MAIKLNDPENASVANAVLDVLEGKVKKEEMDPTDHVKEKDGSFVVVDKNGKEVKSFGRKEEADAYAIKNHDALMAAETKKEAGEPKSKGDKEFKAKHVTKKSGMKDDGTNIKEEVEEVEEATKKEGNAFGKAVMAAKDKGDKEFMFAGKKYKVEDYDKDEDEDEEDSKEEDVSKEESDKQKKYQAFFQKALKKFGVKSPSELDKDKKKEFFDYVDANYEGENESD